VKRPEEHCKGCPLARPIQGRVSVETLTTADVQRGESLYATANFRKIQIPEMSLFQNLQPTKEAVITVGHSVIMALSTRGSLFRPEFVEHVRISTLNSGNSLCQEFLSRLESSRRTE